MINNGQPYVAPDLVRLHLLLTQTQRRAATTLVLSLFVLISSFAVLNLFLLINTAPGLAYLLTFGGLLFALVGPICQFSIGRRLLSKYPHSQGMVKYVLLFCIAPTIIALTLWLICLMLFTSNVSTQIPLYLFVLFPVLTVSGSGALLQTAIAISGLVRRYGTAAVMPLWHFQHQQVEQQMQYLAQFQAPPAAPLHPASPPQ
ncbi:hypothetical protein G7068_03095 [Leucobacter viscericola]|uniref:Uncharacterized protein n=1 Tax=Leucobacter viscericola TaxID=2714935 RepID=A0A6G7XD52_9MICO|nr:hypothetical protein [Leucobacter viscericola]QIK62301.1 hypothetical protein G7068_03095 [Leucobacter viscericola]